MKTKIDISKSIPYMNLEDKVKLLIADSIMQAETKGKESLLIPYERERIINEARKNNQINIIEKYYEFLRLACFIAIDISLTLKNLLLWTTQLEKWLLASTVASDAKEVIDEIIYSLATTGYTDEQFDDPGFQKEIDLKAHELLIKYHVENDRIFKKFDVFNPPLELISYFNNGFKTTDLGVNAEIRVSFLAAIGTIIELKRNLHSLEFVKLKAGSINILLSEHNRLIVDSERAINFVLNREGILAKLNNFKILNEPEINVSKPEDINFVNVLRNLQSVIELSEDDKNKAEKIVEDYLKEHI